ncbi:MAG: DMT family transporter [Candidatus Viridilinea halotolerans]|uniref:DMT family transporter n=1 Tax=Candidatus Viridilinea halotolerans TaxID=2491704 RepID=A0A426TTE3_9CHLR|nr:MAG: DMT family transporter [Candidatus Viridilinea halotolerans]
MIRHRSFPYFVLFAGVLVASTASILVRFAMDAGVPALSIAAGRLALASLLLTPLAWVRVGPELRALSRRDLALAIFSGVSLSFHFATWISSLAFTSVASSVALVATNPLWVGLASLLVFRERLGPLNLFGMAITLVGTLLIGISDTTNSTQPNPLLGNMLALVGAITVSGYLLIGRSLRRRMSVLAYIYVVYTTAAAILVAWAFLAGQSLLGFPPYVYALLLAMALGPQLLGHTAFNYALSAISATFVAIAILGEPLGSALMAFFLFGEGIAPLQLTGFLLLLVGILVASRAEVAVKQAG